MAVPAAAGVARDAEVSAPRRIERVSAELRERSVQALLVTAPANVRYLSGYSGSNGIAVVSGEVDGGHLFITDFRYETQAEQEVGAAAPECERVIAKEDLMETAASLIDERASAAGGRIAVGFDERHLSVAAHARLAELFEQEVELVGCAGIVERLREVKDAGEQQRIAAASSLADEALTAILEAGLAGRGERDVAIDLESRMRRLGAAGASFPTIVASGAHGALPHAQPRDVEIAAGTLVTIDWGALLDGYCSDCTRTYAAGEPSGRGREVYELVLAAQRAGVDAVRAGRSGREVDAIAREVIERAGMGERFGHGLGHGVGLEVHEGPRLSRTTSDEPLREGAVVTVEPGVYLPGELGVRIEDLLVVGAEGSRSLSALPRDLIVI